MYTVAATGRLAESHALLDPMVALALDSGDVRLLGEACTRAAFWLRPLRFWTIIVWIAAIPISHGTSELFSTGSHAQ